MSSRQRKRGGGPPALLTQSHTTEGQLAAGSSWPTYTTWHGLTQTQTEANSPAEEGPLTALLNSINGDTNVYMADAHEDPWTQQDPWRESREEKGQQMQL